MALTEQDIIMMSAEDEAKVSGFTSMWNAAKTAGDTAKMAIAHAGAEAVRSAYGYSGGVWGNELLPLVGATPAVRNNTDERTREVLGSNVGNTGSADPYLSGANGYSADAGGAVGYNLPGTAQAFSIPAEAKKYLAYGGIFIVLIMVLKIIMGRR